MKTYQIFYLANIVLFILSFFYLWLPINFKYLGRIWLFYSGKFLAPTVLRLMLRNKTAAFYIDMFLQNVWQQTSFTPEYHVRWDNVEKHMKNITVVLVINTLIITYFTFIF